MLQTYDEARFWREDAPYMSIDALRARVKKEWTALTTLHGDCGVDLDAFTGHVREALHSRRPGPLDPQDVDALCLEDLYLARGCLAGSDRAIRIFLRRHGDDLRLLSHRHAPRPDIGDDVQAQLLATLFLPRRPKEPESARLASYRGIGTLRAWLRVTARRLVIDLLRRRRREDGPDQLEQMTSDEEGAEARLEVLEAASRMRPLINDAVAGLDDESRSILRHYYRDGQGLKALGHEFGRDTAWAFRRITRIRAELLRAIKRSAASEHQLSLVDLRAMVVQIADDLDLDALFGALLLWVLLSEAWPLG